MTDVETITVPILGKDYQISCESDEIASLMQSAQYLDKKMQEVKSNASILGLDRIAVMAALNIVNDYLSETKKKQAMADLQTKRILSLSTKLDTALNRLNKKNL